MPITKYIFGATLNCALKSSITDKELDTHSPINVVNGSAVNTNSTLHTHHVLMGTNYSAPKCSIWHSLGEDGDCLVSLVVSNCGAWGPVHDFQVRQGYWVFSTRDSSVAAEDSKFVPD